MSERITYEDLTGSNSEQAVVEASPRVYLRRLNPRGAERERQSTT